LCKKCPKTHLQAWLFKKFVYRLYSQNSIKGKGNKNGRDKRGQRDFDAIGEKRQGK
jgi:hypothetical protein